MAGSASVAIGGVTVAWDIWRIASEVCEWKIDTRAVEKICEPDPRGQKKWWKVESFSILMPFGAPLETFFSPIIIHVS